jgi:hypothetical protein
MKGGWRPQFGRWALKIGREGTPGYLTGLSNGLGERDRHRAGDLRPGV